VVLYLLLLIFRYFAFLSPRACFLFSDFNNNEFKKSSGTNIQIEKLLFI